MKILLVIEIEESWIGKLLEKWAFQNELYPPPPPHIDDIDFL